MLYWTGNRLGSGWTIGLVGPTHIRYHRLFIMASDPKILANSEVRQGSLNVLFRHTFDQVEANIWEVLGAEVINVLLLNSSNKISCDLEATGRWNRYTPNPLPTLLFNTLNFFGGRPCTWRLRSSSDRWLGGDYLILQYLETQQSEWWLLCLVW